MSGIKFFTSAAGVVSLDYGGKNALYETKDGGQIWNPVPLDIPAKWKSCGVRSSSLSNSVGAGRSFGMLVVLILRPLKPGMYQYRYLTKDGGVHWNRDSPSALADSLSMVGDKTGYGLRLSLFFSNAYALFRTGDGGKSWTLVT